MLPSLLNQTPRSLAPLLTELGEPDYRATQILEWLWQKRVASFEAMSNLPAALRTALADRFSLRSLSPRPDPGSG